MTGTVAVLAGVAGISAYLVWLYNRLVRLRNLSRSSWSDIDVLLKKRHDLVGNLVETVKGYAGYEKSVLTGVTEARSRAMRAEGPGEKGKEEAALREKLPSLFAVAESYPDLKASGGYLDLQKRLAELENGIEYARRYYNAVVRDYTTATETFPGSSEVIRIDGLRVEYADGFGLARASNTTPVVVLRFEGDTQGAIERIQAEFRAVLTAAKPGAQLPF
mgnify:CR=1 FL=1